MKKITEICAGKFWAKHEYRNGNTRVFLNRDKEICMQLWSTVIARINNDGRLVLNSGGYLTRTTKERLNGILNHINFKIVQKDYNWRIYDLRGDSYPFEDGVRIKL